MQPGTTVKQGSAPRCSFHSRKPRRIRRARRLLGWGTVSDADGATKLKPGCTRSESSPPRLVMISRVPWPALGTQGALGMQMLPRRFRAQRHGAPPLKTLLASDLLRPSAKSTSPTIGRTTFVISTPTAAARLPRLAGSIHTRHAALTAGPSLSKSSIATSVAKMPRADEGTGRSHDGDVLGVVRVGDSHTSCSSVPLDDSQRIVAADNPKTPCSQATRAAEQSPAANLQEPIPLSKYSSGCCGEHVEANERQGGGR
jgi:hypothetical protein